LYGINAQIASKSEEGFLCYKGSVTKKCCETRYKLILISDSMPDKKDSMPDKKDSMPDKNGCQMAIKINKL
jgi:hypothetical protein